MVTFEFKANERCFRHHHHHLFVLVKEETIKLQVEVMARRPQETTRLIREATSAVINRKYGTA